MLSALKAFPIGATIDAAITAKSTAQTSSYVDVRKCARVYACFTMGDMDSGNVTIDFLQATDSSGTGAKALTAGNFAQVVNGSDNLEIEREELPSALDSDNGFGFVAIKMTTDANVAGDVAVFGGQLRTVDPNYQ